jgi:acid phosphatase family membrane protein YuiD
LKTPALSAWELLFVLGIATQLLKLLIYGLANRRLNLRVLVTTNGLPSLHAVVLSCLSVIVGLDHGFRSPLFVATFLFAGVILHDLIRVQGSVQRGQATGLFLAQAIEGAEPSTWAERWAALLTDRGHRPLHIAAGMVLGLLAALAWGAPPAG